MRRQRRHVRRWTAILVGVPRVLSFHYLYPVYRAFLREVGASCLEYGTDSLPALEALRAAPTDEPCPGVKIAFHRCKRLLEQGAEVLFLPVVVSMSPMSYCCPKMIGLPDMIRAGLKLEPRQVASPVINVKDDPRWERSWRRAADAMGAQGRRMPEDVVMRAWRAWRDALDTGGTPGFEPGVHLSSLEELGKGGESGGDLPVTAVMGHAYVLYDVFGREILRMAASYGRVITAEMVPAKIAFAEARTIFEGEKLWFFEGYMLGAALYLLRNHLVDRIIFVYAFSCGPASIIENYIQAEAERQGIPFLGLVVDEHVETLGLRTRIEAFMDATAEKIRAGRAFAHSQPSPETEKREAPHASDLLGPEPPSRAGIVTMGNLGIVLKALFAEAGVDVLLPPRLSDPVVASGREIAPEFICYPMVALLGQCRELCRAGASRIAMVMGKGKCRLGWYAQVMENLLRRCGHEVEVIGFDSPLPWRERGEDFLSAVARFVGRRRSGSLARGAALALMKLLLLEKAETLLREMRAREEDRGSADRLYHVFLRELDEASSLGSCLRSYSRFARGCADLRLSEESVATILLVGEIYVLNEPFVNKDVERALSSFDDRVRVIKHLTVLNWLKRHIFLLPGSLLREAAVSRAASRYLRIPVGGHGLDSVGDTVLATQEGVDGVVHLLPFTCMPEIVAQAILPRVGDDLDIPVLSLVLSEQTGDVGLRTRLEAFVELAWKKRRASGKEGFPNDPIRYPR